MQNIQQLETVLKRMEELCDKFPEEAECWCLHAQALLFFGRFEQADEVYNKAVTNCADNPRIYIQRA